MITTEILINDTGKHLAANIKVLLSSYFAAYDRGLQFMTSSNHHCTKDRRPNKRTQYIILELSIKHLRKVGRGSFFYPFLIGLRAPVRGRAGAW